MNIDHFEFSILRDYYSNPRVWNKVNAIYKVDEK